MPFAELAAPAIRWAREGVRVTPEQAYVFTILEPVVTTFPDTCALYAPDGRLLQAGDLFTFPELADALERLADEGPSSIYSGETAERICAWVTERGGLLCTDDLAAYQVIEREPVRCSLSGKRRAHECAAVIGWRPDRVRARPARAIPAAAGPA